jgi:hypothetical protein
LGAQPSNGGDDDDEKEEDDEEEEEASDVNDNIDNGRLYLSPLSTDFDEL